MKLYLGVVLLLCFALNNVKQVEANDDLFSKIVEGNDNDNKIILGYVDLGANGHEGNDDLIGNRRNNILDGGSGNDTIAAYLSSVTLGRGVVKVIPKIDEVS